MAPIFFRDLRNASRANLSYPHWRICPHPGNLTWRATTKNPNYWGFDEKFPDNRLPDADEIVTLIMPDAAALRGRGQPPRSRARRSAARNPASSGQPSAAASSPSSDAAANASVAVENLADTSMPRDRRI